MFSRILSYHAARQTYLAGWHREIKKDPITGNFGRGKPARRHFRPGSTALAGRQHGQARPAVLAGDHTGILEMIPGGFIHNNALGSARGAGVPDNISGPGAHDILV